MSIRINTTRPATLEMCRDTKPCFRDNRPSDYDFRMNHVFGIEVLSGFDIVVRLEGMLINFDSTKDTELCARYGLTDVVQAVDTVGKPVDKLFVVQHAVINPSANAELLAQIRDRFCCIYCQGIDRGNNGCNFPAIYFDYKRIGRDTIDLIIPRYVDGDISRFDENTYTLVMKDNEKFRKAQEARKAQDAN